MENGDPTVPVLPKVVAVPQPEDIAPGPSKVRDLMENVGHSVPVLPKVVAAPQPVDIVPVLSRVQDLMENGGHSAPVLLILEGLLQVDTAPELPVAQDVLKVETSVPVRQKELPDRVQMENAPIVHGLQVVLKERVPIIQIGLGGLDLVARAEVLPIVVLPGPVHLPVAVVPVRLLDSVGRVGNPKVNKENFLSMGR